MQVGNYNTCAACIVLFDVLTLLTVFNKNSKVFLELDFYCVPPQLYPGNTFAIVEHRFAVG